MNKKKEEEEEKEEETILKSKYYHFLNLISYYSRQRHMARCLVFFLFSISTKKQQHR
jgi:hypothetical protein